MTQTRNFAGLKKRRCCLLKEYNQVRNWQRLWNHLRNLFPSFLFLLPLPLHSASSASSSQRSQIMLYREMRGLLFPALHDVIEEFKRAPSHARGYWQQHDSRVRDYILQRGDNVTAAQLGKCFKKYHCNLVSGIPTRPACYC